MFRTIHQQVYESGSFPCICCMSSSKENVEDNENIIQKVQSSQHVSTSKFPSLSKSQVWVPGKYYAMKDCIHIIPSKFNTLSLGTRVNGWNSATGLINNLSCISKFYSPRSSLHAKESTPSKTPISGLMKLWKKRQKVISMFFFCKCMVQYHW